MCFSSPSAPAPVAPPPPQEEPLPEIELGAKGDDPRKRRGKDSLRRPQNQVGTGGSKGSGLGIPV